MALRSVIDSYMAMSRKGNRLSVQFTTDSRYIVDGMTSWVKGWMARGWRRKDGAVENVPVRCRIDTPIEIDYYQHGGILPYVLRQIVSKN
jgi:aconitase A